MTTYGQVHDTEDQNMEIQKIISNMADTLPPPPRKKQLIQYYSQKYYHDKAKGIKDFVDRHWPTEQNQPVPHGAKKMRRLDYGNKITAEYFERETAEFKQLLTYERDEAFSKAMKEHQEKIEDMGKSPETADSYHRCVIHNSGSAEQGLIARSDRSLANAATFLQPVADFAAKRFGAAISILMVLPIGVNDGTVEMRR